MTDLMKFSNGKARLTDFHQLIVLNFILLFEKLLNKTV